MSVRLTLDLRSIIATPALAHRLSHRGLLLFVDQRCLIADRGMAPLAVVKHFDVVEDRIARLLTALKALPVQTFGLQTVEETLGYRIIPAVTPSAHAGANLIDL